MGGSAGVRVRFVRLGRGVGPLALLRACMTISDCLFMCVWLLVFLTPPLNPLGQRPKLVHAQAVIYLKILDVVTTTFQV